MNMKPFRQQRSLSFVVRLLAFLGTLQRLNGFVVLTHHNMIHQCYQPMSLRLHISVESPSIKSCRRNFLWKTMAAFTLVPFAMPGRASAKEPVGDTIWMTGKMPQVPGQKPRDKNDLTGTRKDPNFLRSLSDCKNQCENSASFGGLSKTKEECLSECQDICCTTYQQCTFAIVQRI